MIFRKWNKIPQFRNIIKEIQMNHDFAGKDDLGNPIYKHGESYPTVKFEGTVKLHGTNAQISYTKVDGLLVGKRSSLIDRDQLGAHFGFNQFVQVQYQQEFIDWFKILELEYALKDEDQLIIYGEWAGGNIQNTEGLALRSLPKSFYIFGVKIINGDTTIHLPADDIAPCPIDNVFNVHDFPKYEIEIDFNNPKASQNELVAITNAVEEQCPVGTQLGVKGIGEGVVWVGYVDDKKFIFKVKGEKHSASKVKTLAEVDPAVLQNINDFIEHTVTPNRVAQAMQETGITERKQTGDFLQWIETDIITEEKDVLKASGLDWSAVRNGVKQRARLMLFVELDKLI